MPLYFKGVALVGVWECGSVGVWERRLAAAPVLVGAASRRDYAQDKVRPGTGREGALGYVRYIAKEHMDVRRDCLSLAHLLKKSRRDAAPTETPLPQTSLSLPDL